MTYFATETLHAHEQDGLLYYSSPLLDQFSDRFLHAFSSRLGGESTGSRESLNLGFGRGDDEDTVRRNWARFGAAVGFDWQRAMLSQQVHETRLREASEEDCGKGIVRPRDYSGIDGWIISQPLLPAITQYADCVPVILYAADKNMAANVHAGWRGTAARIAGLAARQLISRGCDPASIYAVTGPSAGPCCYIVDEDCAAAFRDFHDEEGSVVQAVAGQEGKYIPDLWRANRAALIEEGLLPKNIAIGGICTICHGELFYSQRTQGDERGAMSAVAMLR